MHTKLILLVFLSLLTQKLAAQNYVDIAKLFYNTSAMNEFDNSTSATRVAEVGLDITAPIVLNPTRSFLTGLIYEDIRTKTFEGLDEDKFSSIMLKIGFNLIHSDKWSGTYLLLPKIASDFQQLGSKDFQLGAIAILKYNKRENLKYRVGVYANSELFGFWAVPIVGLYYLSPSKKFEANMTLPLTADLNYALHPMVSIGTNFFGQVRTYHLTNIGDTGQPGYIARSTNEQYVYLKFNLSRSLILQTKVGHSVGRSYRVYNENDKVSFGLPLAYFGDERVQRNTDFSDGLVYQVMVIYRFNLTK